MGKGEIEITNILFFLRPEDYTNPWLWMEFLAVLVIIFATGFYLWGQEIQAVEVVLFFLLGFAAWTDIKYGIIPNLFVGLGLLTAIISCFDGQLPWVESLLSGFGIFVFFLLVRWLSSMFLNNPGFGMGDIKLFAVLGLFLGWEVLWVTYLSLMLGGFFALSGLALGYISRKDQIPFAPFIGAAFILNAYFIPWNMFLGWWL